MQWVPVGARTAATTPFTMTMAEAYDKLYAGQSPQEAFDLLESLTHGQLSHWHGGEGRPAMAFAHYAVSPAPRQIWAHLANSNPMLELLERDPRATFWIEGASAYIPSHWYREHREKAVPTSYYAWAQFEVEVELVKEQAGMLAILQLMLARLQNEGGHPPMDAAQKYWRGLLSAITGLKMTIVSTRSRHKYGQNRPAETRREIAERLTERTQDKDSEVARQVLARL